MGEKQEQKQNLPLGSTKLQLSSQALVWVPLKADSALLNSGHNLLDLCLEGKITADPSQKNSHKERS